MLTFQIREGAPEDAVASILNFVIPDIIIPLQEQLSRNLAPHMFNGISMTADQKKKVLEPFKTYLRFLRCLICKIPRQHDCSHCD